MLLLGIDLGTSSVKVSVVDAATLRCLASARFPETEVAIISRKFGWAEQDPVLWWQHVQQAILKCHATGLYEPGDIAAIGIAYQMHGLVLVDRNKKLLRDSIIWCDSRAVAIGNRAFKELGEEFCLSRLLNSPGNFTASKLAWVKEHEPPIYEAVDKMMLPGDFISMMLTGDATITPSALSEGIFWDFREGEASKAITSYFGFSEFIFPKLQPVFSIHGRLQKSVAVQLGLSAGIPVSYKAGDQLNNALSLNVLDPGEVAATAGTSGVIYGVSDRPEYDPQSRINSFAHVNHQNDQTRIGILLCINGCGIFNRWIRDSFAAGQSYESLNSLAASAEPGAGGLVALPFGNGAERIFNNQTVGAHLHGLDLNLHGLRQVVRAAQEGIAFAFRYGLDIMKENGLQPSVIKAGRTNLFLSEVFVQSFVNATGVPVELYETEGSVGAAIGAGMGAGLVGQSQSSSLAKASDIVNPCRQQEYEDLYQHWKTVLNNKLSAVQQEEVQGKY